MYAWIWRRLPGSVAAKTVQAVVLLAVAVLLLLFVVFPGAEPLLFGTPVVE